MPAPDSLRPEIIMLTEEQKGRVLEQLRRKHPTCGGCGATSGDEFLVGGALYLGYLFLSEKQDAYMVALTCPNPTCPAPHTGIRLHGPEFGIRLRGPEHLTT